VRFPLILYAAWISGSLPVIAVARHGFRLAPARVAVFAWALLLVVTNGIALALGSRGVNNHWVLYLSTLLEGVAVILALTLWQVKESARLMLRVIMPLYLVGWLAIMLMIENTTTFSIVAGPFSSLILLTVSAGTLVSRAPASLAPMTREDWFWISIGFIVFYGVETGLSPLSLLLLGPRRDLVAAAYQIKAGTMIVAMLAVTKGLLCPIMSPQSGGSSSRSASPSLSLPPLSG